LWLLLILLGAARNWDEKLERVLADTGYRLETKFREVADRQGHGLGLMRLGRGGRRGRDCYWVRGICRRSRCRDEYGAKMENAWFDTEIPRRKAIAGFSLEWIGWRLDFGGSFRGWKRVLGEWELSYAG